MTNTDWKRLDELHERATEAWSSAGRRALTVSGMPVYAVKCEHENGTWDVIFCKNELDAALVAALRNAYPSMQRTRKALAELYAALDDYGTHHPRCTVYNNDETEPSICDCGLDAALAAARRELDTERPPG